MSLFERVCRPHVQLPGCKITCGAKKKKEKKNNLGLPKYTKQRNKEKR